MPELDPTLTTVTNRQLQTVGASAIRAFDQEVSQIPGILKLTLGEPDFNTPEHVKRAAIEAIQANESHYAPQKGFLGLRQAIADYLHKVTQVTYDPNTEITVTSGATEAIYATLGAILNPGDEVVVPTPIFSLYLSVIQALGAVPILVDTSATDFVLTPAALADACTDHHPVAVIINDPTNPTGVTYPLATLQGLAKVAAAQHLFIVADEIYNELVYDGEPHYSLATQLPGQTIVINGVSKSHAMTGYRIGYVAAPATVMAAIAKLHGFLVTSTSNPAQAAAERALREGQSDPAVMRDLYQRRRDYLRDALAALGFSAPTPRGAFYLFAKIPTDFEQDSMAFARQLAQKAHVGVTPGSAFGPGGDGYIRLSYAASDETLQEAVKRIRQFVNQARQVTA